MTEPAQRILSWLITPVTVVSMTASVESIFGSARMAGGMFLNNQLTDFARDPFDGEGNLVANHAAPGKYPRSSMSPTVVLDENGGFLMATGSPGGNSNPGLHPEDDRRRARLGSDAPGSGRSPLMWLLAVTPCELSQNERTPSLLRGMRQRGFEVKESAGENSGLSVVVRSPAEGYLGGVDPTGAREPLLW